MKTTIAIILLVAGIAAFGNAISKLSSFTSTAYSIGFLLPSSLIIVAGIYLLTKRTPDKKNIEK